MSKEKIGEKLRRLRLELGLPLRKVAAELDVDVAILSKMERGQRKLTKSIVERLAGLYHQDPEELMVLFLSQKIMDEVGEEGLALRAMVVAEASFEYATAKSLSKESIYQILEKFFRKDPRVKAAWIYGSFARGDSNDKSDIDVMVKLDNTLKITLFDFADITFELEKLTNKKIDLVEEGCLLPFAQKTAQNDLIKIYG